MKFNGFASLPTFRGCLRIFIFKKRVNGRPLGEVRNDPPHSSKEYGHDIGSLIVVPHGA